jgi:hypothetical protein
MHSDKYTVTIPSYNLLAVQLPSSDKHSPTFSFEGDSTVVFPMLIHVVGVGMGRETAEKLSET